MNKGIFITGTDTGVGKTYIAAGLIRALKEKGLNVCPMKPVESGCRMKKGSLVPPDAVKLLKSSSAHETLDLINPYRLKNPLAPSVAAEIEGVVIKKRKIITAYNQLRKKYEITMVEGAGGIMVPIYKRYKFIDLVQDLGLPLLIISRPGLGTINHTLLTIESARKRGIHIVGIILNNSTKARKELSDRTNPEVIERLGQVAVLGSVPYIEKVGRGGRGIFRKISGRILETL